MKYLYSISAVALILLTYYGFPQYVYSFDTYYISTFIFGFFCLCSVFGLRYRALPHIGAELCARLGLFGTIVGFSVMVGQLFSGASVAVAASGAAVALHTTAIGMIGATFLYIQSWINGYEEA